MRTAAFSLVDDAACGGRDEGVDADGDSLVVGVVGSVVALPPVRPLTTREAEHHELVAESFAVRLVHGGYVIRRPPASQVFCIVLAAVLGDDNLKNECGFTFNAETF